MPSKAPSPETVPQSVVIIGGSLSGLMHGLVLQALGCPSICILEQSPADAPESHMAGVCLGPDALTFLKRFDRTRVTAAIGTEMIPAGTAAIADATVTRAPPLAEEVSSVSDPSSAGGGSPPPLGLLARQLQSIDASDGKARPFLRVHRVMSSWDALYFRLRANFDGLRSEYVPFPPPPLALSTQPEDGENGKERAGKQTKTVKGANHRTEVINEDRRQLTARYETGKKVTDIDGVVVDGVSKMRVQYRDHMSEDRSKEDGGINQEVMTKELFADLVIGADGPNSLVRRQFLGDRDVDRKYVGYLAWRGVVPEDQVSAETRNVFKENLTYSILGPQGGHVIVYNIPGPAGSIMPGQRLLNFCWYTNHTLAELDAIMTDVDGVRHRTSVPPGKVRKDIWSVQQAQARLFYVSGKGFPPPYLEILSGIASPFVHLITDYVSPSAAFADGKVLLVGDAAALFRPHIAFSTNQAAAHALLTEKLLTGVIKDTKEWEWQILTAGSLHWMRSVWFGDWFQRPFRVAIWSGVTYWWAAAKAKFWCALGWLPEQAI